MHKNKTIRCCFYLLVLLVIFFVSNVRAAAKAGGEETILVHYNGNNITQRELDTFIKVFFIPEEYRSEWDTAPEFERRSLRGEAISDMLEIKLVLSTAKEKFRETNQNMDAVIQEAVEDRLTEMKEKRGSRRAVVEGMHEMGITLNEWKNLQSQMILYQSFMGQEVKKPHVKPAKMKDYYYRNRNDFKVPQKIYYRTLYVTPRGGEDREDVRDRAERIVELAREGEDFKELVRRYSFNYDEATEGLHSEEIPENHPHWRPASVRGLQPGEISDVIDRGQTFVIAKLEKIEEAGIKDFREVQGEIYKKLMMQKFEENQRNFLDRLEKKAHVEFTEEARRLIGKDDIFSYEH